MAKPGEATGISGDEQSFLQVRDAVKNELDYRREWNGSEELTIASGVVTVSTTKLYRIDTESGDASDTLATINFAASVPDSMKDGMVIYITPENDARTVVLDDGGNIQFSAANTITLAEAKDIVKLAYRADVSKWQVISHNGGAEA